MAGKGGDDVEDLGLNPFFKAFLESEHYKLAAKHAYVVCVPARASLGLSRVTPDFLCTHILRVSPYFKNEYVTGEKVEGHWATDSVIIAGVQIEDQEFGCATELSERILLFPAAGIIGVLMFLRGLK